MKTVQVQVFRPMCGNSLEAFTTQHFMGEHTNIFISPLGVEGLQKSCMILERHARGMQHSQVFWAQDSALLLCPARKSELKVHNKDCSKRSGCCHSSFCEARLCFFTLYSDAHFITLACMLFPFIAQDWEAPSKNLWKWLPHLQPLPSPTPSPVHYWTWRFIYSRSYYAGCIWARPTCVRC